MVGLLFANEVEANHFNAKIEERILKRRSRASQYAASNVIPPIKVTTPDKGSGKISNSQKGEDFEDSESAFSWRIWKKNRVKSNDSSGLKKCMIEAPDETTMVHFQGLGGPNTKKDGIENAFSCNNIDPRMHKFLTTYGLDAWLMDPIKAAEIDKWANKNDFYGKIQEAKAERKMMRASKITSRGGPPLSKPPPPPPPLNPMLRNPTRIAASDNDAEGTEDQLNVGESLDEKIKNWLEIKRQYLISSSEEEDEMYDINYDSDEWN